MPDITIEHYKLSDHFSLNEMTKTSYRKYLILNKEEAIRYLDNLHDLCDCILEPVRSLINVPVIITSGFRYKKLNKAIGGSKNSQHIVGKAADIEFLGIHEGKELLDTFNKIAFSSIKYSQIIYEFGQWIHIGLQDPDLYPGKIQQKLIAERFKNRTIYRDFSGPVP